ncbi:IS5 family transposase [Pseudonocardia sp. ICBG601]|uniref:IS5 family transposase n=2 Tax=Pseudonocardia sp. ICBG601 TaxID=2846759 RepID=UPI0035AB8938
MVGVSGWSTRLGCSIVVGMQERPRRYPSDTSDAQWVVIEPLLPPLARRGRPVAHARRDVLDAILYVVRTGCAWRALPVDFPPWQTVYWYFNQWEQQKVTEKILPVVRGQLRIAEGRDPEPSAGIIDSQSVKGADTVGQDSRGYDAGKKTGGRKRFIVTDTLGLLLTTMVCSASVQDRDGAKPILLNLYLRTRVRFVYADAGFAGRLLDWAATILQTTIEIIRKPPEQRGFTVLPRRWVVERTLAWLTAHRRPRLRTPPHHIRSHDPLGRDQHHHPPHRPWIPRHPPAETHDTLNPLEFPNTLSGPHSLIGVTPMFLQPPDALRGNKSSARFKGCKSDSLSLYRCTRSCDDYVTFVGHSLAWRACRRRAARKMKGTTQCLISIWEAYSGTLNRLLR